MSQAGIFKEFHAVIVPVSDVVAAARWYEQSLGLKSRKDVRGMTVLAAGGTAHLCLFESPDAERPELGVFPNFRSENLDETRSLLIERGVPCSDIQSMPHLRFMTLHDPDGNRIDVCEYGPDWLT